MWRTASIGLHALPPAVTEEPLARGQELSGAGARPRRAASSFSGARRAGPIPVLARGRGALPVPGSMNRPRPRSRKPAPGFACVAGCSNIRWFHRPARTISGQRAAKRRVRQGGCRRARFASFAIVFAEAGAITKTSAAPNEREGARGIVLAEGGLAGNEAAQRVALELAGEHRRTGQRGKRKRRCRRKRFEAVASGSRETACPRSVCKTHETRKAPLKASDATAHPTSQFGRYPA